MKGRHMTVAPLTWVSIPFYRRVRWRIALLIMGIELRFDANTEARRMVLEDTRLGTAELLWLK